MKATVEAVLMAQRALIAIAERQRPLLALSVIRGLVKNRPSSDQCGHMRAGGFVS
jgi:hypothetical protein